VIALILAAMTVPASIDSYIDRRQSCVHWAGEEPYDARRARQIESALRRDRCDRIDSDERRLRRRYSGQPDLLRLIDEAVGTVE
jgi:hypothetical protein